MHDFYAIAADLFNDSAENWHISQAPLQLVETSHSGNRTASVHMMHIVQGMHPVVLYSFSLYTVRADVMMHIVT
jgi:hypothetical protein